MTTSTQLRLRFPSLRKWVCSLSGSIKITMLVLLSFFTINTNAQIVVNGLPGDWCSVIGGAKPNLHVEDILNGSGDDTEFNQGTSDVLNIPEWHWGIGQIADKTDLGNVGLVVDGCTVYFFADRFAANGDADLGLWLFKNPAVSTNPDGTFNGTHLEGDLLITSKFTNGGGEQTTKVYIWTGGQLVLLFDTELDPSKESIAGGTVNASQQNVPCGWNYTSKTAATGLYPTGTFFEGRIDLCALEDAYPQYDLAINECFANFIFKTSQSPSPTSANGDLVFGNINSLPLKPILTGSIFCAPGTGTVSFPNSSASVRYYLERLDAGNWVPVSNSLGNGGTLTFMDLVAGTYRVRAVNINTISLCETISDNVAVTSVTANGGTGGPDQTICGPSGDPGVLSVTGASTGTYQWQSNTTGCGGTWLNISGATGATYDPPAITVTTYYRRVTTVTSGATSCPANSSCITVTINNVTGGTGSADQTHCGPANPTVLSVTGSTSSQATPTYQWQSNTTGCGGTFVNIEGATAATYDPPAGLTTTTYYRRVTTSTVNSVACPANSTCITVTVNNVTGGTGSADQTHCGPANPTVLSVTGSTSSQATPTYQWQSNTTGCGGTFVNIEGATAATYDPPAGLMTTTYYRRVTTSTVNTVACPANSTCITVNIGGINAGTIAASQVLCSPANPAAFTSTADATGATTPTYQWQSKLGSCEGEGWANIPGATLSTYDAPAGLTATTSYRRVATSTLNNVPCSANSNCITVTVTPTPAPPVLTVVNNCESSTITARDGAGALIPGGELTWTGTNQTGNPIIVTTTTQVTATRTVGGCTSGSSNAVTPAPIARPGAPTGVSNAGCIGQQVTISASGCTGTYTWYATNISTAVLGTGSSYTTPPLNQSTTYYVSCTVGGCEGPRTPVTATVTACGAFCTYTQGAWGSAGGKMCDGTTGGYSTIGLLNEVFENWGASGLIIGSNGNTVKITAAQCILDLLPGGGNSYALTGAATTCDQIKTKYAKQLNNGTYKINNTLLAQTITLGLNLGINDNLASFSFATHSATNKYLITAALTSCGSTSVVPNSNTCDLIDPAVIALLKQAAWPASGGGDYPATVAGLYSLANYALGGQSLAGTGVTLESIAGVVDAINNAFDECRAFVSFSATCPTSNRMTTAPSVETSVTVTTSPNPYSDRIRFVITSKVSGQASLEVYNLTGQKVATPFRGYINAGRAQNVEYSVPSSSRGNLVYRVVVKDKFTTGKVLSLHK